MSSVGTVKSWNSGKGFGFINAAEGDVFFKTDDLSAECRNVHSSFLNGRSVYYDVLSNPHDGRLRATRVLLAPSSSSGAPPTEGEQQAGIVKSYNEGKGYGFITSSVLSDGQEVMFQRDNLKGLSPEQRAQLPGAYVYFKAATGPNGKMKALEVSLQNPGQPGSAQFMHSMLLQVNGSHQGATHVAHAMPPQTVCDGMESFGVVKSFSEKNGYGFINVEGSPEDFRFTAKDVDPSENISSNSIVKFTAFCGNQGRLQARDVRLTTSDVAQSALAGQKRTANDAFHPAHQFSAANDNQKRPRVTNMDPAQMFGTIKSWSDKNGYGFISVDGSPGDYRFTQRDFDPSDIMTSGLPVGFTVVASNDGRMQARQVRSLNADMSLGNAKKATPATNHTRQKVDEMDPAQLFGTVKSWNEKNGYGFITVDGAQGDYRFTQRDFDPAEEMLPGVPVGFTVVSSNDGRMQARQVRSLNANTSSGNAVTSSLYSKEEQFDEHDTNLGLTGAPPMPQDWTHTDDGSHNFGEALPQAGLGEMRGGEQWATTGEIKTYNPNKKYGFITSPELADDAFFMRSDLPEEYRESNSMEGYQVSFSLETGKDGKYRASDIKIF